MKRRINIPLLISLILFSLRGAGQNISKEVITNKHLTAESNFKIEFFDTTATKLVKIATEFETKKGYSIRIADEDTSKRIKLGLSLNYFVFEFEFNKGIENTFGLSKAIKPTSLGEVYRLLWGLNGSNNSNFEAGVLQLNNSILVLDNSISPDFDRQKIKNSLINERMRGTEAVLQKKLPELIKSIDSLNKIVPNAPSDTAIIVFDGGKLSAIREKVKFSDKKEKAETKIISLKEGTESSSIYDIKNIEFQFERGFIEKVKVWINYKNSVFIFENIYAIGFSSIKNYKALSNTKLYIRNTEFKNDPYIYLSDVIRNYDNRLHNYTRDYSPADTSFVVDPNAVSDVVLNKENYINIVDSKIFTDLNGAKKSNPNGLFQIELSKRFNVNTVRRQVGSFRSDWGAFNYIYLFGAVNKIEQNNRSLTLHNANSTVNGKVVTPNYAANLDFLRYENYSCGVILNGFLFDAPDQKFTSYLDFGIKYAYLNIKDSVISPQGLTKNPFYNPEAHTITLFPKMSFEFFSEYRISFNLAYSHNLTLLFSNNAAKQVMSYQKSDLSVYPLEKRARRSNVFEALVKVAPSRDKTSQLFLRFRFYTQYGDASTSFSQIQVGYFYNWTIAR